MNNLKNKKNNEKNENRSKSIIEAGNGMGKTIKEIFSSDDTIVETPEEIIEGDPDSERKEMFKRVSEALMAGYYPDTIEEKKKKKRKSKEKEEELKRLQEQAQTQTNTKQTHQREPGGRERERER
jgi:hypothetical protein